MASQHRMSCGVTTQNVTWRHNTEFHVASQHRTSPGVTKQNVTWCHNTELHVASQHRTSRCVTTQHVTWRHNTTRHMASQHSMSPGVTTQHVVWRHNTACHVASQHRTSRGITTQNVTWHHSTERHVASQHRTSQSKQVKLSLSVPDEYWSQHPELHDIPIYYASSLAKKCMAVYQTYVNAMNDKIRRQIAINNPFVFRHISNLKVWWQEHSMSCSSIALGLPSVHSWLSVMIREREKCLHERSWQLIRLYSAGGNWMNEYRTLIHCHWQGKAEVQGDTKKNRNFWKTQQKLKKSKKKNLLTEIEPLQLAF